MSENKCRLRFFGAAGTVTGSKFLLETPWKKILIDCGLFQGIKKLRLKNWDKLPVDASTIDYVLLTHGHLDHTGYLPRLHAHGFKGKIICTDPTKLVTKVILEDSARIQEEDAERANREGFSKHHPAKPLYNLKDVDKTLEHFYTEPLDTWFSLGENIKARFRYNSHIIGATFIEMQAGSKRFVFSGDIGRSNDPLMFPPERPETADVILIESTYGNKKHPDHAEEELAEVIMRAAVRNGTIIIPSFAVERTQLLMYLFWQLRKKKKIPEIPVFMDSPMGINVLSVFHNSEAWHKLSKSECDEMCSRIRLIRTFDETKQLVENNFPKIVIAGSGMVTGGRVLTYLQKYLSDPDATVLLVGYQAEGTRGRQLLQGAGELKIHGHYYQVRCHVDTINGLSAHGDQDDLIHWLSGLQNTPEKIFIVHGEPGSSDGLRLKIREELSLEAEIPDLFDEVEIGL